MWGYRFGPGSRCLPTGAKPWSRTDKSGSVLLTQESVVPGCFAMRCNASGALYVSIDDVLVACPQGQLVELSAVKGAPGLHAFRAPAMLTPRPQDCASGAASWARAHLLHRCAPRARTTAAPLVSAARTGSACAGLALRGRIAPRSRHETKRRACKRKSLSHGSGESASDFSPRSLAAQSMAATPLAVSPEAVELRVGDPLRLQLPTGDARVVGEISWFFEGSPLPAQTGPVCRCAVALARSVCALALVRRARALLDARGVGGAQAAMRRGLRGRMHLRARETLRRAAAWVRHRRERRRENLTELATRASALLPCRRAIRVCTAPWCSAGPSAAWRATFRRAWRSRRCAIPPHVCCSSSHARASDSPARSTSPARVCVRHVQADGAARAAVVRHLPVACAGARELPLPPQG